MNPGRAQAPSLAPGSAAGAQSVSAGSKCESPPRLRPASGARRRTSQEAGEGGQDRLRRRLARKPISRIVFGSRRWQACGGKPGSAPDPLVAPMPARNL